MKKIALTLTLLATITASSVANAKPYQNPDAYNYDDSGQSYCREFNQSININGQQENGYGTACQQPDGSWKIVKQDDENYDSDDEYAGYQPIFEEPQIFQPANTIYIERYQYPSYRYDYRYKHRHGHRHHHHDKHWR